MFEEEVNTENMLQFDAEKGQSSYIKVIGVGGGGGNAVNHMFRNGIKGADFIVCNTDEKALMASPVPNKIVMGTLGVGGKPEVARNAALAHKDQIREALGNNTKMLFITAGMGGGTGTGAAPVVAEIAKSIDLDDEDVKKILVVAVVTMPFKFEGMKRNKQALAGVDSLFKQVDSILVINNDKLRAEGNLTLTQAFGKADDVLLDAVKGIAEIITKSTLISVDFNDVNTVMEKSGTALMGTGIGKGENRALQAIEQATTSVLLNDNDIKGAQNALLYFSYSPDHEITMDEIGEITDYVTEKIGNYEANIIWGNGPDETLNDELKVTFIATGYSRQEQTPRKIELEETHKVVEPIANQQPQVQPQQPVSTGERKVFPLEGNVAPVVAPVMAQPIAHTLVEEECPQECLDGMQLHSRNAQPQQPQVQPQQPQQYVPQQPVAEPAPAPAPQPTYYQPAPQAAPDPQQYAAPAPQPAPQQAPVANPNQRIENPFNFNNSVAPAVEAPAPQPQEEMKTIETFNSFETFTPQYNCETEMSVESEVETLVIDEEKPAAPVSKSVQQPQNEVNFPYGASPSPRPAVNMGSNVINDRMARIRKMNEMLHSNKTSNIEKIERVNYDFNVGSTDMGSQSTKSNLRGNINLDGSMGASNITPFDLPD